MMCVDDETGFPAFGDLNKTSVVIGFLIANGAKVQNVLEFFMIFRRLHRRLLLLLDWVVTFLTDLKQA
ncbi:hypothetical protein L2E82_20441 [Cichorium intybus]|uniref:Uncharacterized protein n=1 Tax=Cichorium intybus TaxID=13427 RepID=A0ACB9DTP3_CICIN|nr:hypothetical protein L2E82_20441 [Cichorium intybus]